MQKLLIILKKNISTDFLEKIKKDHPNIYKEEKEVVKFLVDATYIMNDETRQLFFKHKIDWALMPPIPFSSIKLIVSDMDSTFINIECIDEIASYIGIKNQVAKITEKAMNGEIDFEESLRSRCFLLKGIPVAALDFVYKNKLKISLGINQLLRICKEKQIQFYLASGGFTYFTDKLKELYALDAAFGNTLEIRDEKITGNLIGPIVDAHFKQNIVKKFLDENKISKNQVIVLGDGANDILMFQEAGISIAYKAKEKVKENALFYLDFNDFSSVPLYFD